MVTQKREREKGLHQSCGIGLADTVRQKAKSNEWCNVGWQPVSTLCVLSSFLVFLFLDSNAGRIEVFLFFFSQCLFADFLVFEWTLLCV